MKKIIINENWEEEIIEDNSSFFALIFKQGTNSGYIKSYSTSNEEILKNYNDLITAYEDTSFSKPAKIYIVKLPATGQVKAMLEQALYTGEENNTTQIEIINHLLGRADCEYIGEDSLGILTEAKKKKKKKKRKTPRVTYTMGFPWLNDHRFNHACGSCDCGKDAADNVNDAIGGGESVGNASSGEDLGSGDFGGGEGGAMGESLNEASMTPLQKMQALENGTRGFNATAASDQKLYDNVILCTKNNLATAADIMITEIKKRLKAGTWSLGVLPGIPTKTQTPQNPNPYKKAYDPDINALDFQPSDIFFIWEHKDDLNLIIESLTESTARQTLFNLIVYLILAVYLKEHSVIEGLKSWIIDEYNMTSAELKELILKKALNNKEIHNRIIDCINTANSERK